MRFARDDSSQPQPIASASRGIAATTSSVAAIRCSQVAAFSLAGARIAAIASTPGTASPVTAAPGA